MGILEGNIFLITLIISLVIQAVFFIFAATFKTDKVTDMSYGLSFLVIGLCTFFTRAENNLQQIFVAILVTLWSVRITTYLAIRIFKMKKDARFDEVRDHFWKFAKFWLFQGITVWVIMLPAILVMSTNIGEGITSFLIIGKVIWLYGFIVETFADIQKYKFKSDKKNKNKFIQTGFWKYSRHPNYFGEMLMWWGIFVIAIPYLTGFGWLVLAGPLFITYILRYVTGIPPLEKRYDERYKKDKAYQEYKKKTNLLIVGPRKN